MVRCIIPARKNSRRIKEKNLLKLNGETLIDISVNAAIESAVCDQIIVSTDIKDGFNARGAVIDRRPKRLASDFAVTDKIIDYLANKYDFLKTDTVILLQPTSPCRKPSDIVGGLNLFKKKKKPVVSVFRAFKLHDNLCADCGDGLLKKIKIEERKVYQINGALFIFSLNQFREKRKIPQERFAPYVMNEKESTDIDEYLDYIRAAVTK
ncbi:MAG: hypothetical protein PHW02_02515 [bacterium]|nr:hypothetical protein [bacterium]